MVTLNAAKNGLEHKLKRRLEDIELRRQRASIRIRKDELGLQMLLFKMTQQFGDYACLDTPEDVRAELKKGIRRSIMAVKENKAIEKAITAAATVNDPNAVNPLEAVQEEANAAVGNDDQQPITDGAVEEQLQEESTPAAKSMKPKSKRVANEITNIAKKENKNRKRRQEKAAAFAANSRPDRPSYKKVRELESIDRSKLNCESYTGLMGIYRPNEKEEYLMNRWLDKVYPTGNNMSATICGLRRRLLKKDFRNLIKNPPTVDKSDLKKSLSVSLFPEIVKYKPRQLRPQVGTVGQNWACRRGDEHVTSRSLPLLSREDDDVDSDEERDVVFEDLPPPSQYDTSKPLKNILKLPVINDHQQQHNTRQRKKVSITLPDISSLLPSIAVQSPPPITNENYQLKHYAYVNETETFSKGDDNHRNSVETEVVNDVSPQRRLSLSNNFPISLPGSIRRSSLDNLGNGGNYGSNYGAKSNHRRQSLTNEVNDRRQSLTNPTSELRRSSRVEAETASSLRRMSLTLHTSRRASLAAKGIFIGLESLTGEASHDDELQKEWDEVKKCRYIRGYDPPEMITPDATTINEYVFHHGQYDQDDEFEATRNQTSDVESNSGS